MYENNMAKNLFPSTEAQYLRANHVTSTTIAMVVRMIVIPIAHRRHLRRHGPIQTMDHHHQSNPLEVYNR